MQLLVIFEESEQGSVMLEGPAELLPIGKVCMAFLAISICKLMSS